MKFELIIFLFLSLTISTLGLTRQEARKNWDDCLAEYKLTKAELDILKKRKSMDYDCFTACVMKKRGTVTRNGKIDVENFLTILREKNLLNNAQTEEQLRRCAAVANKEPNECSVVKNMLDCFFIK